MKYENLIKIVLSILYLGCLGDWDYGYYQLVRFLGMIGFGLLAYYEKERGNQELFILWLASAVLINPIFKISLGRFLWNIVDVFWAALLIGSIFYKPKSD
ncbi:MAG: DUF6804 family protein [Chitinophagales bacterium]